MSTLSRRDFLKLSSAGLAAWQVAPHVSRAALPRLVFAPPGQAPRGDVLVCVFQRGGMDGLNAVIPHGDADYYRQRPSLAIPEPESGAADTGVDLDGFFGLHPALAPLKEAWDDGGLAIVHAVGSPDATKSHFDAMDYMERGTPGEKTIATGWLARHLQTVAWENDSPFRAVGMGQILQQSLRGPIPVTALKSIAEFHLQGRAEQLAQIQQTLASLYTLDANLGAPAQVTFDAMDLLAKVDPAGYTPANGAAYPDSDFGFALLQVAQLIKAEVGLEVACVDIGGWDTHVAQGQLEGELPGLLSDFGGGLAAFYADLGEWKKTVSVVTMSEFGRRAYENGGAGTDHGHGNVMFVLGGNVNGGRVHGEWPGLAPENLYGPGDLAITTDFRDVLGEVVQKRLQNHKLAEIFPGYTAFKMRGVVKG